MQSGQVNRVIKGIEATFRTVLQPKELAELLDEARQCFLEPSPSSIFPLLYARAMVNVLEERLRGAKVPLVSEEIRSMWPLLGAFGDSSLFKDVNPSPMTEETEVAHSGYMGIGLKVESQTPTADNLMDTDMSPSLDIANIIQPSLIDSTSFNTNISTTSPIKKAVTFTINPEPGKVVTLLSSDIRVNTEDPSSKMFSPNSETTPPISPLEHPFGSSTRAPHLVKAAVSQASARLVSLAKYPDRSVLLVNIGQRGLVCLPGGRIMVEQDWGEADVYELGPAIS